MVCTRNVIVKNITDTANVVAAWVTTDTVTLDDTS